VLIDSPLVLGYCVCHRKQVNLGLAAWKTAGHFSTRSIRAGIIPGASHGSDLEDVGLAMKRCFLSGPGSSRLRGRRAYSLVFFLRPPPL